MGQKDKGLPTVFLRCLIAFAMLTIVGLTGLAVYAWWHIGINAIPLVVVSAILTVIGVIVLLGYSRRD